jgi:hypothetical protein
MFMIAVLFTLNPKQLSRISEKKKDGVLHERKATLKKQQHFLPKFARVDNGA